MNSVSAAGHSQPSPLLFQAVRRSDAEDEIVDASGVDRTPAVRHVRWNDLNIAGGQLTGAAPVDAGFLALFDERAASDLCARASGDVVDLSDVRMNEEPANIADSLAGGTHSVGESLPADT